MKFVKLKIITLVFILLCIKVQAQVGKVFNSTNKKQLDSAFLQHPFRDKVNALKANFTKKWKKTFVEFTDNDIYVLGGLSLSKQYIDAGNYNSSFNYNLSEYERSASKPGYFAGARVDGIFKEKHRYSFGFGFQRISTGTQYKNSVSLTPFLGNFSKFKADDQFFNLTLSAHYKREIPFKFSQTKKFFLVGGPSLDTRLSRQSLDNLVNHNYRRFLLRADIGLEFDNNEFYTIFIHYRRGVNSFTKAPIKTNLNAVEIGMFIKASDIF